MKSLKTKSTPEDIRQKFNLLVERYSNLDEGQNTAVDSPLIAGLIAKTVSEIHPDAESVMDIGCGAGNYSLRIAGYLPKANFTLVDLSEKMLEKAEERLKTKITGSVNTMHNDIRNIKLQNECFDIVVAGTSLHHLRGEEEWYDVFGKIREALKPGGSFWISDVVLHDVAEVNSVMWNRYDEFLIKTGGENLRNWVMEQMEKEDTPRSLNFQIEVLKKVGFRFTEILHKNVNFAAFGGIK